MSKQDLSLPWVGRPSQILNSTSYMITAILIGTVIYFEPLMYSYLYEFVDEETWLQGIAIFCGIMLISPLIKYLSIRCIKYTITDGKIFVTTGILSSTTENVEMYRVKDQTVHKPISLRLLGLGNIVLLTSDPTTPTVKLSAIGHVEALVELIQKATLTARKEHQVKEFD